MAVWFELAVDVPQAYADIVAGFLVDQGTPGLQTEERGGTVSLLAYFAEPPPIEPLRRFCSEIGATLRGGSAIRTRTIPDEDWAQNWKLHFQPQTVGDRLYISPSWESRRPPERVAIVIDPGMAFGTGQHATTRGCLSFLDRVTQTERIERALDVGTGTGILAIALAKLQVPDVWAVDNDPTAKAIALENAVRNGVDASIRFADDLDAVHGPFGVVTANLFANLLVELAGPLTDRLAPGGTLICSGLLDADEHAVRSAYRFVGCGVARRQGEDHWVTLALQRQTGP